MQEGRSKPMTRSDTPMELRPNQLRAFEALSDKRWAIANNYHGKIWAKIGNADQKTNP
jgi:hypothetical protein